MMKVLYRKEYAIVNVSTLKKPGISRTQIIAQKGDKPGAEKLGGLLGINDVLVSGTGDTLTDFTIVICNDWKESLEKSFSR
jgi:hypothetical protein